jgi:hypothetical protein
MMEDRNAVELYDNATGDANSFEEIFLYWKLENWLMRLMSGKKRW